MLRGLVYLRQAMLVCVINAEKWMLIRVINLLRGLLSIITARKYFRHPHSLSCATKTIIGMVLLSSNIISLTFKSLTHKIKHRLVTLVKKATCMACKGSAMQRTSKICVIIQTRLVQCQGVGVYQSIQSITTSSQQHWAKIRSTPNLAPVMSFNMFKLRMQLAMWMANPSFSQVFLRMSTMTKATR
jgi:hypothetical protein